MNPTLSFPKPQRARIDLATGSFTYVLALACTALLFLFGVVLVAGRDPQVRLVGLTLIVLPPILFGLAHRGDTFAETVIDIDRRRAVVRRKAGRYSRVRSVGGFTEVQVYAIVTPGRYDVTFYGMRIVCWLGFVTVGAVTSREPMVAAAQELAAWLQVPFTDLGEQPYLPMVLDKSLV